MSSTTSFLKQLYVSRKNLLFYLNNLGYDVTKYDQFNLAELNAMEMNSTPDKCELDFKVFKNNDEMKSCTVRYFPKSNIKPAVLEPLVSDHYDEYNKEDKLNHKLVVILPNPMNDTLQKSVKMMWKKYKEYVSVLDIVSLQFNILKHSFVPQHIKLNEDEKLMLYERFNITNDSQLPEIGIMDPVAKVLLLCPGEVCKIIRHDKISLRNEFYRICVI